MEKNPSKFLMRKGLALFAIFLMVCLFSCKKDGKLSPDFDDNNLSILFTDTFAINSTVVKEDSLRADLSIYNLLGIYNDPIFGPMSSSIYAQVTLTGLNIDFDSPTSTFDSIVLTLDYQEVYGTTSTPVAINVYELSNDLLASNEYYTNNYISHFATPIGNLSFVPNEKDSVSLAIDTIIRKPHLRIRLDDTFGENIFIADADGSNQMVDNTSFTNFMKGLYITTVDSVSNTSLNPGTGFIAAFNMNSSLSTVTIYYNDTSSYDFTINTDGVKYSRFAHNYTGTDVEAHINQLPTRDTTLTYVSTMAGVRTKLEIPNIKDIIEDGTVIINKAELVLTIEGGSEGSVDAALESISLAGIDENGDTYFLPDFFEGLEHYGGFIDAATRTYTFNITRHVNDLIYNTTTDYGMYLIANGSSITTSRSVLGTDQNVLYRMRLDITYSKL